MNAYLAEIELPIFKSDEYLSLLPEQRAMIGRLLQAGVISQFSLNADRTRAWMVIYAASKNDAEKVIEKFPLYNYMSVSLDRLLFTASSPFGAPALIMN